jgi:hypothetical protein
MSILVDLNRMQLSDRMTEVTFRCNGGHRCSISITLSVLYMTKCVAVPFLDCPCKATEHDISRAVGDHLKVILNFHTMHYFDRYTECILFFIPRYVLLLQESVDWSVIGFISFVQIKLYL